ncbi:MAG: D-alanine--D-alanine ligase family protein [Eubacteriales bacterium]
MKIRVGVLFGGKSVEHEVSIISALQAIQSIPLEKYEVVPIYITKDNEFYVGQDMGDVNAYKDVKSLLNRSQRVTLVNQKNCVDLLKIPYKRLGNPIYDSIDLAFPIVHGTNVEDGTLQGLLKMLNIPFVGCDVTSSAVGMDKYIMKTILKDCEIPVLDCLCFHQYAYQENVDAICKQVIEKIDFPVIVKPLNLGSSIGIRLAKDEESLEEAMEYAFEFSNKILVEKAVEHLKEINCAVLGDAELAEASECEEPINADDILSFEDKYLTTEGSKGKMDSTRSGSKGGMTSLKRKLPADITSDMRNKIRKMAVDTFQVLDCNGVARIDFLMNTKTNEVWVNEINTIPGSLSFYLWEPIGCSYSQLLEKMIELSFKRQRELESIEFTFETNILNCTQIGGMKGKA